MGQLSDISVLLIIFVIVTVLIMLLYIVRFGSLQPITFKNNQETKQA